jgi:GAF domain-containing protein
MPHPIPPNETERQGALRRYRVLDTERERSFDDISKLAAYVCGTPIAAVSLVDADRQWFKATVGLDLKETSRDQAFCSHTIMADEVMVVEDATKDVRFSEYQLVTGKPHVRFYAGVPLSTRDSYNIGALCVFDSVPRQLSDAQKEALLALSRLVMTELDLRELNEALADSLGEVKALRDILPTCSYCSNIRNEKGEWGSLQDYIMDETTTRFSHGVCPACAKVHFPGFDLPAAGKK